MTFRTLAARTLPALLLLVAAAAAPARAQDPTERLVALIRESGTSANPAMAFMRGLGQLPDFQLGEAQVRRALQLAQAPTSGMLHDLLAPTTRLSKRGDRIEIDRSRKTVLALGDRGAIELDKRVRARLRVAGAHDATIDEITGLKVGETRDDLYGLKKVVFTREGGKPVAKVTAGAFIFSKTVTIDLSAFQGGDATSRGIVGGLTGN